MNLNKGGQRFMQWKRENVSERSGGRQINVNTSYVYGLKKLTLLICSYYTKLSTDNVISTKSLMEF